MATAVIFRSVKMAGRLPKGLMRRGLTWGCLVSGGLLLTALGCAAPERNVNAFASREEPVFSDEDYLLRHQRMLDHVMVQPVAARKRLEGKKQRNVEVNLAFWEEVARRRERFIVKQEARIKGNLAHYEYLMEVIRRDQEARRQKQEALRMSFLNRMGNLRREPPPSTDN